MSPLAGLATLFACGSEPNGTLADYDKDDDGSAISEGDCNDLDPAIGVTRPDAEGDGIDSDCDGSDGSLLRLTEVAVAIYHGGTLGGAFGHQVVAGPDLDSDGLGEFAVLASEVYAPQPAGGTVFVLSFAGTGEHSLTQDDALIVIVDSSEEIDDIAFVTPLAGGRLAAACNTPDNIAGMDGGVGLYLFDDPLRKGLGIVDADGMLDTMTSGGPAVVASVGDLFGDGIDDVIIRGVQGSDLGASGVLWAIDADIQNVVEGDAAVVVDGWADEDSFGDNVIGGDFNGDGLGDLVITGTGSDPLGRAEDPAIIILEGSPTLVEGADAFDAQTRVYASDVDAEYSLAHGGLAAGRVDVGAAEDLIVCDHVYNEPEPRCGRCWLDYGPLPRGDHPLEDFPVQFQPAFGGSMLGRQAAIADYDGDGLGDVILAAPDDPYGSPVSAGRVYVWLAPFDAIETTDTADVAFKSDKPGDGAGSGLAASDLDGDGRAELLIGAPDVAQQDYYKLPETTGSVYVIAGGTGL